MAYIWWRDGANLPSVKSLSAVFGERAKEARELLEGKRKTTDYESVRAWERSCYHRPGYTDRVLCALNEIADTYGVERIEAGINARSPAVEYLNAGDTYTTTLCLIDGRGMRVTDWGSIVERGNYA